MEGLFFRMKISKSKLWLYDLFFGTIQLYMGTLKRFIYLNKICGLTVLVMLKSESWFICYTSQGNQYACMRDRHNLEHEWSEKPEH